MSSKITGQVILFILFFYELIFISAITLFAFSSFILELEFFKMFLLIMKTEEYAETCEVNKINRKSPRYKTN